MEEFIAKMADKCGIDHATATKVVEFLKEHAHEAIPLLEKSGMMDRLPGGLGDKLGKLF